MNASDVRRYDMLLRVRDFGATRADLFPPSSMGGQMFEAVRAAVAELSQNAASQVSGRGTARESATSKAVARAALRDNLEAISSTAHALAQDTPGLEDKFRMPRQHNDQALLDAARAFAQDAEPLAQAFITHELSPTFLTDLRAEIGEFERAAHDHVAGIETSIAAGAEIEAAVETALAAVHRLDAIVRNRLRDRPEVMAVWQSARHIERSNGAKSAPIPTPSPVPTHTSANASPAT